MVLRPQSQVVTRRLEFAVREGGWEVCRLRFSMNSIRGFLPGVPSKIARVLDEEDLVKISA